MKPLVLPLLLCLALGAPAWGASGLEAARARAQEARTGLRELRGQQQGLREELNTLAGRIEALKAQRQGKLTPGAELETALRRSQELSGSLTGLAQAVAGAEGDTERAHLALYTALSEELARVRAAWDAAAERPERARLTTQLRALRAERDAVRAALPPSRVPALDKAGASDDPADLLEQADALRDSEDKVRQRLGALKARITEVREERDLERRMSDFLGEDSMFDEQDRRLRLRTDSSRRISVDDSQRRVPADNLNETVNPGPPSVGNDSGPQLPTSPEPPVISGPQVPLIQVNPSARASDVRLQVDAPRAQQLAAGGMEDLASLEAEAARLESLARELGERATTLERQGRELQ
ncbi:TetR family transcriptional regulator [Myxococcaceae bacterium GXIMD 01537]